MSQQNLLSHKNRKESEEDYQGLVTQILYVPITFKINIPKNYVAFLKILLKARLKLQSVANSC